MTHRPRPPKQHRLADLMRGRTAGAIGPVVAAHLCAIVALAACGSPPPQPDHGSYSTTEAAPQAAKPFPFPRAKRLTIAPPSTRFTCVRDWAETDLRGKGISVAALPFVMDPGFVATRLARPGAMSADELAALDGTLVLAIMVDAVDGPGGSWNPWSGAITSSLARLDMAFAVYEPGNTAALWRGQSRVRTASSCPDPELKTQLQQLLDSIR